MVSLVSLWLPILVSAVAVFFASFLAWMVLPHHKADWKGLPDEDAFLEGLRSGSVASGQYMYPHCTDQAAMKEPKFVEKWKAGPHGTLNVWPGPPNMGRNLVFTFLFYCVVGVFVGYLGTIAPLQAGADFMTVFRFAGTAAVAIFTLGPIAECIWFGKSTRAFTMSFIDDVVYGIIMGLAFAWLWPAIELSTPIGG